MADYNRTSKSLINDLYAKITQNYSITSPLYFYFFLTIINRTKAFNKVGCGMKQGILVILLIATISVVAYALYQPNQERINQLFSVSEPQETLQPTPSATLTPALAAQPTVVIIVPTAHSGPTKLPNTGAFDAGYAWSDTPTVALLIGLLITSATVIWLGRRD
jgi:hypothetical protein